jgi:hypothetical protein
VIQKTKLEPWQSKNKYLFKDSEHGHTSVVEMRSRQQLIFQTPPPSEENKIFENSA